MVVGGDWWLVVVESVRVVVVGWWCGPREERRRLVVRVIRASVRPRAARANTCEREAAATRCVVALYCVAACAGVPVLHSAAALYSRGGRDRSASGYRRAAARHGRCMRCCSFRGTVTTTRFVEPQRGEGAGRTRQVDHSGVCGHKGGAMLRSVGSLFGSLTSGLGRS